MPWLNDYDGRVLYRNTTGISARSCILILVLTYVDSDISIDGENMRSIVLLFDNYLTAITQSTHSPGAEIERLD